MLRKVLYVTKKFNNRVRSFNDNYYGLTWYTEFQFSLIEYFAQCSYYQVIYKLADTEKQSPLNYAIENCIKDAGCKHITICRKPFLKALPLADRVIVDHPSGALFEAAIAGKHVLCICPDHFRISEEASKIFGKSIQQFKDVEQAKEIISEFLYGKLKDYIPALN